ncbi:hypothetical protein bpr_II051 (plasmid) [Butyrivibrio proteoclasticus B316]|uniref:Uncharacterized protein n=1 Tax=Butyrivibrio proteoclasticus (strain ATCC 51982 / DSM 14932 / B316) TaxID=515622 RepID=E0S3K9_BUTPB|nr:hypothetical protein [Butyrivibrio proteoclasticus]ADL35991.1 hypothetical protein bpr_II051 [Butyrivibrio proteoclasticus B316]
MSICPEALSAKEMHALDADKCRKILEKYSVSEEDAKVIMDVIDGSYDKIHQIMRIGKLADAYIRDEIGEEASMDFFAKAVARTRNPGTNLAEFFKAEKRDC